MNHLLTPKPSNWLLVPGLLYLLVIFPLLCWWGCSSSQPQLVISDPTTLCANALVMSSEVRSQAAKIGKDPSELAQQACAAAVTAIQLARANFDASAGASSTERIPLELAGAAGSP